MMMQQIEKTRKQNTQQLHVNIDDDNKMNTNDAKLIGT